MRNQTQPNPNQPDAQSMLSQIVGQQLEAEEQMPPQQIRPQNQSSPKPLPPIDVTIGGNNFAPADIEHLVTTAQEPPTGFDNEVQAELDRLAQARTRKA